MVAIARIQSNIASSSGVETAAPVAADAGKSPASAPAATTDAVSSYVAVHGMHSGKAAVETLRAKTSEMRNDLQKEVEQLKEEAEELAKKAKDADSSGKIGRLFGALVGSDAGVAEKARKAGHAAE